MDFKTWFEDAAAPTLRQLLIIRTMSQGTHGGPGEQDTPAGPPKDGHVAWDVWVRNNPQADELLRGLDVQVIEDKEGGSYHERWQTIFAYVSVPSQVDDELQEAGINLSWWDGKPMRGYTGGSNPTHEFKVTGTFKYTTADDAVRQVIRIANVRGPNNERPSAKTKLPAQATPSAEDWWKNQVRVATVGQPPTRPGIDGHTNKWDGD
jgi:hypothetical protein